MKNKIVNWGMIGVGDVTETKSGPALYKTPHSRLLAVTSRTREKAESYAIRHQIQKVYNDIHELVKDPDIDIIYIATPPDTHKKFTLEVLTAGKAVYVEKPMAMTCTEAEEMYLLAEQKNVPLFVAFYRRALPYFTTIQKWVAEGRIGKILSVSVELIRPPLDSDLDPQSHNWRLIKKIGGEGYFADMAPHTFDILDFILGPIADATGYATNIVGNYDVPDTVCASWRHTNQILGSGYWTFSGAEHVQKDQVVITGTKGKVCFSTFIFSPIVLTLSASSKPYSFDMPDHIQQPLVASIVGQMRGESICPSTAKSALRTMKIIEKILQPIT